METYLAAREPPVAEGQRAMVARVLEKSRDRANPVRRVFAGPTGRIAALWDAVISGRFPGVGAEGGGAAGAPLPCVPGPFTARIAGCGGVMRRVTALNLRVYAPHYNEVIARAVAGVE